MTGILAGRCPLIVARCTAGLALAAGLQATAAQAADLLPLPKSRISGPSPFTLACDEAPDPYFGVALNAERHVRGAANPRNPLNLIAAWQQDSSLAYGLGVGTAASFDGGLTWQRAYPPLSRCAGGQPGQAGGHQQVGRPQLSFSRNGTAHLALNVFSPSVPQGQPANAIVASRSSDGGRTWGAPTALITGTLGYYMYGAPAIAADPADARFVYAAWSTMIAEDGEPDGITFARSTDNGLTWEPARVVNRPGDLGMVRDMQIVVLPGGGLLVTYIVGIGDTLPVYAVRSTDRGSTWSAPVKVSDRLPGRTHEPQAYTYAIDGASDVEVAVDPRSGTVYVAWDDGRWGGPEEDSSIALSQSRDGGQTWIEAVEINRVPSAQAFTPAVHVRPDGTVGVAYYDFRNDTPDPATLPTDLWLIRSRDGLTWRESHVSGPFDLERAPRYAEPRYSLGVGWNQALLNIGPLFVSLFVATTPGPDTNNRTDVFARPVLLGPWPAAQDEEALARAVEQEEQALPAYSAQGTERPVPATRPRRTGP